MQEAETIVAADRWHLDVADMTPGTRVDGVYAILNPQVSASRSGKPFLKCIIRDATGTLHALEYAMIQGPDGWLINGVTLLPPPDLGV